MSSDDDATEETREGMDSFVSFAMDESTEERERMDTSFVSFAMDESTEENRAPRDSFGSFAMDDATEENRARIDSFVSTEENRARIDSLVAFAMDDATEANRSRRDSNVSFAIDDATDDNRARIDSFVSRGENRARRDSNFSFVDGDDIVEYTDANGEKSSQGSEESERSHDEGEDRLGPMEGEVQKPRVLPRQAEIAKQNSKKRLSSVTDIETGKQGGARGHSAHIIPESVLNQARSPSSRRRQKLGSFMVPKEDETIKNLKNRQQQQQQDDVQNLSMHGRLMVSSRNIMLGSGHSRDTNDIEFGASTRQYRLQAVAPNTQSHWLLRKLGIAGAKASIYEDTGSAQNSGAAPCCTFFGLTPNNLVIKYLHWTFRSSFMAVFLSAAIAFIALTIIFALFIWALGRANPSCIGGVDFDSDYFTDAYALSWTTFSTVGYGSVYSGTSATEKNAQKCTGVTIIVTLEAFVGILFASFCGAILFAKVARIQSFAQVMFSDPIVIRYGNSLMVDHDDVSEEDGSSSMDTDVVQIPCPVMEFRIVNRLHSTPGGEIIDASIQIVASIDASQACPTIRNAATRRRRGGKKGKKRGVRQRATQKKLSDRLLNLAEPESKPNIKRSASTESLEATGPGHGLGLGSLGNTTIPTGKTHQAFDEDPTGHLVPRRIFSKLEIESPDHPFFKRVWMVRHTVDHHSPLLRAHARNMVRENGGFWPKELNSHEGVRAAIHFDKVLVSMSGTSNADANSVYAQKVYDFIDVNVGYRFVNPLYRDLDDGSLRVDTSLINDVTEQAGGGGEPFTTDDERNHFDMVVL